MSSSATVTATSASGSSGSASQPAAPTLGQTSTDTSSSSDESSAAATTSEPSAAASTSGPRLSVSAPTLSNAFSYPPPTVPAIANAPYMQSSHLPENFVFIVVGAALGFIVLIVFVWRLMSTWAMNRNSKRVAAAGTKINYTPLPDLKNNPAAQSGHDMADLSKLPRSFSSVPSLFFSPTAEAARQSQRPPSRHLPAGHYRDASDPLRR